MLQLLKFVILTSLLICIVSGWHKVESPEEQMRDAVEAAKQQKMAILSKYEKMTEELLNKRKALLDERNRERERGSKGIEESATKLTEINKKLEEVNLKTRPLPRVVEPSPPVPSLPIYFDDQIAIPAVIITAVTIFILLIGYTIVTHCKRENTTGGGRRTAGSNTKPFKEGQSSSQQPASQLPVIPTHRPHPQAQPQPQPQPQPPQSRPHPQPQPLAPSQAGKKLAAIRKQATKPAAPASKRPPALAVKRVVPNNSDDTESIAIVQ